MCGRDSFFFSFLLLTAILGFSATLSLRIPAGSLLYNLITDFIKIVIKLCWLRVINLMLIFVLIQSESVWMICVSGAILCSRSLIAAITTEIK